MIVYIIKKNSLPVKSKKILFTGYPVLIDKKGQNRLQCWPNLSQQGLADVEFVIKLFDLIPREP
jgi:hypothetical protein